MNGTAGLTGWPRRWLLCLSALAQVTDAQIPADTAFSAGADTAFTIAGADLLTIPSAVRESGFEFVVAAVAPRLEAVLYPIPLQREGDLWSQWGDGVIGTDGRFYSAIGDHGGPGGRSFIYAYDPKTRRLELVVDQQEMLGQQPEDWGFGKIHGRLDQFSDGWLYWATYWGNAPPVGYTQRAELFGMVVRANPKTGQGEILGVLDAPYVMPTSMADTRRGLLYALPCDRRWEGRGFAVFDVSRQRTIYRGHLDTEASHRFIFVDETDGSAWFSVRPDPGSSQVWLARYDSDKNRVEEQAVRLPTGYGPVRAGTEHPDPLGHFYGVSDGHLLRLIPEARSTEPLGLLWPKHHDPDRGELSSSMPGAYTTVLEISPGGRYLYAIPNAHGQAWRDGAPVLQYDTRTGVCKVLAFLGPALEQRFAYRVGGSYCLELSLDGASLFFGINGQLMGKGTVDETGFGHPASMVLHIPPAERLDDSR